MKSKLSKVQSSYIFTSGKNSEVIRCKAEKKGMRLQSIEVRNGKAVYVYSY